MDWGCQYEKANNLERMLMAERILLMAYIITLVCMTEIFVYLLIIENQVNFDMYVHVKIFLVTKLMLRYAIPFQSSLSTSRVLMNPLDPQ